MIPDPLHPAIVHFPIVLVFLLPISAIGALWAIRRGSATARAWAIPVALSAALALSAWAAVQTGSAQDEKVENVVPDAALESHEEGAELFLNLSAAFVLLAAAGFVRGGIGRVARVTATAGALGLVVVGARVGHSGGKLVYTYGAGSAYVQPNASAIAVPANRTANTEDAHGGN